MSIFSKFTPISTALLPNAESDDIKLVLKSFLPWNWSKWREGKEINELENKFSQYFGVRQAISFSSGRVGLYAILSVIASPELVEGRGNPVNGAINTGLSAFGGSVVGMTSSASIPRNDSGGEILLQAYTTIALPLAIKKAGFAPVYVDIKEDMFNIDPVKIEAKITDRTKAIIVQHTFGIPAEMDKISEICKKHNLFLIEDCAHSLGAEFDGKKLGIFGDAAFFSFGRDKIISSTSGGMVIAKNEKLAGKIKEFQYNLNFPSIKWILRQLFHPLIYWAALSGYYFLNIGKFKIFLAQKIGLISRAYSKEEKKGEFFLPLLGGVRGGKMPNIIAILALNQFKKIERFNDHRRKITEIYQKEFHYDNMNYHSEVKNSNGKKEEKINHFDNLDNQSGIKLPRIVPESKPSFLYYTIQVDRRDELLKSAAKKHIILGDWFPGALGPKGIDEEKFGYKKGDCPIAEKVGLRSLNLPTNIKTSEMDAGKIVEIIKEFLKVKY